MDKLMLDIKKAYKCYFTLFSNLLNTYILAFLYILDIKKTYFDKKANEYAHVDTRNYRRKGIPHALTYRDLEYILMNVYEAYVSDENINIKRRESAQESWNNCKTAYLEHLKSLFEARDTFVKNKDYFQKCSEVYKICLSDLFLIGEYPSGDSVPTLEQIEVPRLCLKFAQPKKTYLK